MLRIKKGINLADFHKLHTFTKGINKGYELVFPAKKLRTFFTEAPDDTFLFLKVSTNLKHI